MDHRYIRAAAPPDHRSNPLRTAEMARPLTAHRGCAHREELRAIGVLGGFAIAIFSTRLAVVFDRGEPLAEGRDDDGRREEVGPHENGFGGGVVGSCDRWDER